mgnify:CR=1 FL=1
MARIRYMLSTNIRNPLQAAKQRRCGQVTPPPILFREAGQTYQVKGVCNMPIEMATPKIEHKPYAHHDDN